MRLAARPCVLVCTTKRARRARVETITKSAAAPHAASNSESSFRIDIASPSHGRGGPWNEPRPFINETRDARRYSHGNTVSDAAFRLRNPELRRTFVRL